MNIPNRKLPNVDKFKELPPMPVLGLGTIWLGRRWPADNEDYKEPSSEEIHAHLDLAYGAGIRMFDTAAAYGSSEEKLGDWLKTRDTKDGDFFIATKWGEGFDARTETSVTDHSIDSLRRSFAHSMKCLPQIDLLYIHKANEAVLNDEEIRREMSSYIKEGKIRYSGASISDATIIEGVVNSGELWFDFLQTSAGVLLERPELIKKVFNAGVAVVINSPIRKSRPDISPEESYLGVADRPFVSFVLTGTRTHLGETIDYFL